MVNGKTFSPRSKAIVDQIFARKHLGDELWLHLVKVYQVSKSNRETARFLLHCGFNLFWVEAKERWEKFCPSAHKIWFAKQATKFIFCLLSILLPRGLHKPICFAGET